MADYKIKMTDGSIVKVTGYTDIDRAGYLRIYMDRGTRFSDAEFTTHMSNVFFIEKVEEPKVETTTYGIDGKEVTNVIN